MAKRDKPKTAKQKQWQDEQDELAKARRNAGAMKARLRGLGYMLPYFDFLDSWERIFNEVAESASARFPSLVAIREVPATAMDAGDMTPYGIGSDWEFVLYDDGNPGAATYTDPDETANIRAFTRSYLPPGGGLRTLVLVQHEVVCEYQHRDYKYVHKLLALFHELGHVQDFERQVNFNTSARTADLIAAEVYAHRFALAEAHRLGVFTVAETLVSTLRTYVGCPDFRSEVAARVLESYVPPVGAKWQDLTATG